MRGFLLKAAVLGTLSFSWVANATCPDLQGTFEGPCSETKSGSNRTFNWKISIEQTGCEKVKVSGWALSSVREVGVQFVRPDTSGKGSSYRATPTYFFDLLMYFESFGEDPAKPWGVAVQTFRKTSSDTIESLYELNKYPSGEKIAMSCTGKRVP